MVESPIQNLESQFRFNMLEPLEEDPQLEKK